MQIINKALLNQDDIEPFTFIRADNKGEFFIAVDHAGNKIPSSLNKLGLDESELSRHIAYDIGALEVAKIISQELNAPLIYQNYSRLVIDCNRRPELDEAIPTVSEYTNIPGNIGISLSERQKRIDEIHTPYHKEIRTTLDNWQGKKPIFLAIHSCTPVYKGEQRELEIGCLYGTDRRYAGEVLKHLQKQVGDKAADNQPYQVSLDNDYSIPIHAEDRQLLYVEIEIRQDLISNEEGVSKWASILKNALLDARQSLASCVE